MLATTPSSMPHTSSTPGETYVAPEQPDESAESADDEIHELNQHTNGVEFHGSTSSAAVIGYLHKTREQKSREEQLAPPGDFSLISTLHNPSFSPSTTGPGHLRTIEQQNYYFDQAHEFMNGYFENIHFIHPLIDKEDFLARSNELWFSKGQPPSPSFVALYLSVLSFGSLVRVWDEDKIAGLGRFEWSRKLFGEAHAYLNHLRFSNDLETVQCLYLMVSNFEISRNSSLTTSRLKFAKTNLIQTVGEPKYAQYRNLGILIY